MGLLDSVIGALGQAQAGGAGGLGQGGAGGGLEALLGGLGGGLAALIQKFQQAGLGDVVASWISSGPNRPISGEQLSQVLGGGHALGGVAQQAGLDGRALMDQLAQLLPQLVDQLTPDGRLPDAGQLSSGGMENLAQLLGGSLRR